MGAKRDRDGWLEDFSFVLSRDALRQARLNPKYVDVFAGSRPRAALWLAVVAAAGGALGGLLVSGALWRSPLQVPLWLVAMVAVWQVLRRATRAVSGATLAFFVGWCLAWGVMIGAVAMWAGQLSSSGWAYGFAGGIGFLVGIVGGVYEHDDLKSRDAFFAAGMLGAPLGAILGAWLYRNPLASAGTLESAAVAGAIAGLVFLGPAMAVFFALLDNVEGLRRYASMLLHRDDSAPEALPLLDAAIRLAPDDAGLFDRRALAHALLGNEDAAEADAARHRALAPDGPAGETRRGWVHLRQGRPAEAAAAFEAALVQRKRDAQASAGLGVACLQLGDPEGAIAALGAVPGQAHNALSLSYLAEAHLAAGDATSAVANATTAIDELDSIHGRSFLVRARARRALGDIEGAARDYNKALAADDEPGVEESAMAGLEEIDRPVMSEEDWWEDEEGWEDDEDRPEPPLPGGDRGTP